MKRNRFSGLCPWGGLFLLAPTLGAADQCLPLEQAEQQAEAYQSEGRDVIVASHTCPQMSYAVLIGGLAGEEEQHEAIARLGEEGIEAAPAAGTSVWVGEFRHEDDAEDRLLNMLGYGFRSIEIVYKEEELRLYQVVAADDAPPEPDVDRERHSADEPESFTFGDDDDETQPETDDRTDDSDVAWDLDDLRLTSGYLPSGDQPVETYLDGTMSASLRWQPAGPWELRAGARFDAQSQSARPDDDDDVATTWGAADYTENWVRYRANWGRLTAGTQTVSWGAMDFLPPGDRLSAQDLTRGPLEFIDDSRRASPSLRLQTYGSISLDLVLTPVFRAAELPRRETLWHPVDQRRGRLLGVPDDPRVRTLVQQGTFDHEPRSAERDSVGGMRLIESRRSYDVGVTVQSARRSAPYYALSDRAREAALEGDLEGAVQADGDTFIARHPRALIIGGDYTLDAVGATWRLEGVWSSDEPATREDDLRFVTRSGLDWAAGVEFFPGDGDLRTSLQLTGQHLLDAGDVLDPTETYQLGGELEQPWARERWHTRLRFNVGLDRTDVYINPELAWTISDAHEVTVAGHYFRGTDDTLGGYFEDHRIVTLGWRLSL